MKRVRFAPSPTGTLHVGNALTAVANRRVGDFMLLRIDDTDPARNLPGGEEAIVDDLGWLGIDWDEGPMRQSERQERYAQAAAKLGDRFDGITLRRPDGTATYHLASVVDDIDFEITHVIRGKDHLPNERLHRHLHEALGTTPPEYIHHGLVVGEDGKKMSKRAEGSTIASLREAGIPPEAVRAYLEELGLPRGDVRYDLSRIRRLSVETIASLPDEELGERLAVPAWIVPVVRGSRDLKEAREAADLVLVPVPTRAQDPVRPTLERFRELRAGANGSLDHEAARGLLRELKAVGGDLRALRLALTGRDRGPELAAIVSVLDRDETLRRIDAAL